MADPIKRAQYNEDQRIKNTLKAEREGRTIKKRHRVVMSQPTKDRLVPVQPLHPYIKQYVAANRLHEVDGVRIDAGLGIDHKIVRKILANNGERIYESTADTICTKLNLPFAALYPQTEATP